MDEMLKPVVISIRFDGDAMREHRIPAEELIASLKGALEFFSEADRVANDGGSGLRLHIQALKPGSFEIQFVGSFLQQMQSLFGGTAVTAALNFVATAGVFFSVAKAAKGLRPKLIKAKNALVEITLESGEVFDVDPKVAKLLNSPSAMESAALMVSPIKGKGVDFVDVSIGGKAERFFTDDYTSFNGPLSNAPSLVEGSEATHEGIVLSIEKISFSPGKKWAFSNGESTFGAEVKDKAFLDSMTSRRVAFVAGDSLRVDMRSRQLVASDGKMRMEHEILKVREHLHAPKQSDLFGA